MKKLYLLLIFFFINISYSFAWIEDFIWGTPFYVQFTAWSWATNTYYMTWQSLYIKSINCINENLDIYWNNATTWWWWWSIIQPTNLYNTWTYLLLYRKTSLTFSKDKVPIYYPWNNILDFNHFTWIIPTDYFKYQVFAPSNVFVRCKITWLIFDIIPNLLNSNTWSSMSWITIYTDSKTLNIFNDNNSLLDFYIFEFAIIILIIITALLFRLFKF